MTARATLPLPWSETVQPVQGIFLKRYKRFFADFILNGETHTAHVANTGSLKGVLREGVKCLVLPAINPDRKLRWTLVALEGFANGEWIGVDTSVPNRMLSHVFENRLNPHWESYVDFQSEVKINSETRLDACLISPNGKRRFLEIKNVTLATGDMRLKTAVAQFPDAVTVRGQKHIQELVSLIEQGHEAELIFAIQRVDCDKFSAADDIDPEYGRLLRWGQKQGLMISPWRLSPGLDGVRFIGVLGMDS